MDGEDSQDGKRAALLTILIQKPPRRTLVEVGPVGPCEVQGVLDIALPVMEPPSIALLEGAGGLEPHWIWHQGP